MIVVCYFRLLDKSREELKNEKQIDLLFENLKYELTSSSAERENVERTHGAEARHWKNNYYNMYLLKETVDTENNILKRELGQLKKQFVSTLTKQLERSTDGDRLEERQVVLLREKEDAVKERDEARTKLQLTEKRTKDLESRIQNLLFNPEYPKPSSSSVSREPVAPTEAPPPSPPHVVKRDKRKASLQNRVQEFKGRSADTPKATPRLGRVQSSQKAEGLETYRPDLLTSFIHKHTPLVYKTRSITATNLSYYQRPDSMFYNNITLM